MSSSIVLDASFVASMVLLEPASHLARSLWGEWQRNGIELLAPALLPFEVASAIRKHVHRKHIGEGSGLSSLDALQALVDEMTLFPAQALLPRAWKIAANYSLPNVYDACYVALAEELDSELWTVDAKLARIMPAHAEMIKIVGSSDR